MLRSTLVAMTSAPDMPAPDWSVTWPVMAARYSCAKLGMAKTANRQHGLATLIGFSFHYPTAGACGPRRLAPVGHPRAGYQPSLHRSIVCILGRNHRDKVRSERWTLWLFLRGHRLLFPKKRLGLAAGPGIRCARAVASPDLGTAGVGGW